MAATTKRLEKGTTGAALGNFIYIGLTHVGAPDSEESWTITRIWYDATGDPAEIQVRHKLSWDNRTIGWPSPTDLTLVSS